MTSTTPTDPAALAFRFTIPAMDVETPSKLAGVIPHPKKSTMGRFPAALGIMVQEVAPTPGIDGRVYARATDGKVSVRLALPATIEDGELRRIDPASNPRAQVSVPVEVWKRFERKANCAPLEIAVDEIGTVVFTLGAEQWRGTLHEPEHFPKCEAIEPDPAPLSESVKRSYCESLQLDPVLLAKVAASAPRWTYKKKGQEGQNALAIQPPQGKREPWTLTRPDFLGLIMPRISG